MRLRNLCLVAAVGFVMAAAAVPAHAALLIEVDKSTQQMTVSKDGETLYTWPVSTGIASYDTPSGEYKPFRMEREHFSREWDDAPMPHSIFFTMQGHAIHGSFHKSIGRPASHGCVRLEPQNARVLFDLVRQEKMANTRVVLTGEIPAVETPPAVARRQQPRQDTDYERRYSSDMDDGDDDAPPPPPSRRQREVRGGRDYNYGPRYYYREQPFVERRIYRSFPPFPFSW